MINNKVEVSTVNNVRIGNIDLSFHAASAAVVREIIEQGGTSTDAVTAPHEALFEKLSNGEIDLLVSAWLPASHGKYVEPIEALVTKITTLYEPYCIWAVPAYVPEEAVASVTDLLKPEVVDRFSKRIQGINPGAGISRFSLKMIEEYGLAAGGFEFRHGTEADCFDRAREGIQAGDWFVVPLWHPQFLHEEVELRALEEPLGLLGGRDKATLLARRDAIERIPELTLRSLEQLNLGNQVVSALDFKISVQSINAAVAARQWLEQRPS